MFEAGDIREWRGHNVVDTDGHKIGILESVYVDTGTDLPAFATVTVGLPTRQRLVFVPLTAVTVGPSYLRVAYLKQRAAGDLHPALAEDVLRGDRLVDEHDRVLNAKDRAHGMVRVPRHGAASRQGPDLGA